MKRRVNTHHLLGAAVTDRCLLSFLENPLTSNLTCHAIFNCSKYTRWYVNIVTSARERWPRKPKDSYSEKHHIIPYSLGGVNKCWNYVYLTPKEHYVCHRLLERAVQLDSQKRSMMFACFYMTHNQYWKKHNIQTTTFTSSMYAKARTAYYDKLIHHFKTDLSRRDAIRQNKLVYWSNPANRAVQSARVKTAHASRTKSTEEIEKALNGSRNYWSTVTTDEKQRIYDARKKTAHNRGRVSYFDPSDYSKFGLHIQGEQPIGWVRGDPSLWENGAPSKRTLKRWAKTS